ncbi:DUF4143 domain-containing protein [Nocardioides sp. B-3]|uniref:DUF4143 domain-containing protein n=1 Tax=Nocardioides sp. B-3 TaxID=2895565 RepID=UPI002153A45C|nr:DUF4143 domain-containing protein [Nocardioides sp. B-3]UUZ60903.1 DUF4143 domain-containing protein [Nocardioides sp. B-3]
MSLSGLFDGDLPKTDLGAAPDLDSVIDNLLRPGFPAMTALSPPQASDRLRGYIDDVARTDIHRIADIRHEPEVVKQLVAALARSVASDVTYKTLAADIRTVAPAIDEETVSNYVGLLQRLFIVEAQRPWTPALRSRARVRTSPKLHLVDPALAAAALGAGPQQLRGDLKTLGTLFESAVVHDLTVLASPIDGEVSHYRDSNNKEIDAIITLPRRALGCGRGQARRPAVHRWGHLAAGGDRTGRHLCDRRAGVPTRGHGNRAHPGHRRRDGHGPADRPRPLRPGRQTVSGDMPHRQRLRPPRLLAALHPRPRSNLTSPRHSTCPIPSHPPQPHTRSSHPLTTAAPQTSRF